MSIWKMIGGKKTFQISKLVDISPIFLPCDSLSILTALIERHETSVPLYSIRACIFDIFKKQKGQKYWNTNRCNKMCMNLFECLTPSSSFSAYSLDKHTLQIVYSFFWLISCQLEWCDVRLKVGGQVLQLH